MEIKALDGVAPARTKICITASGFGYKAKVTPNISGSYVWSGGAPILELFEPLDQQSVTAGASNTAGGASIHVEFKPNGQNVSFDKDLSVFVTEPIGEMTDPAGWNDTFAQFVGRIGPTNAWYGNVNVKEFDNGLTDDCWFPLSIYDPWEHLDGSVWVVGTDGRYTDLIGWYPALAAYYQLEGRTGRGMHGTQIMKVVLIVGGGEPQTFFEYTQNSVAADIVDYQTLSCTRDGVTQTRQW